MTRALAIAAAVLLTTSLTAQQQQRAPGSESITQADLRADLFFVAGDAMRGRLTDTNENRATADYVRARFERAGLKPVAGTSYFQNYNLMTATIGEGNTLTVPADNDGMTDVWFAIYGANLNLDADGNVESVLDAGFILEAYLALCEAEGHDRPNVIGA